MTEQAETTDTKNKAVTILGFGQSALERRHDILRYCEGTEIWTLNTGHRFYSPEVLEKVSRWYELHQYEYIVDEMNRQKDEQRFRILEKLDIPVIVTERLPCIEKQYKFPFEAVFSNLGTNVFNGTPCLMVMQAITEGYKEIRSFGIDQLDAQHADQRGVWAFILGIAHERGIKITGTAPQFLFAPDNDLGLHKYRDTVGERKINI